MDSQVEYVDIALAGRLETLRQDFSLHLKGIVPHELCRLLIESIDHRSPRCIEKGDVDKEIIKQCEKNVFTDELCALLDAYFEQQGYQVMWPRVDVVGDDALTSYASTTWHLDHGLKGSLKLFVYLDSVADHGCNTLMFDRGRTEHLRQAGAFPLSLEERKDDLTCELEKLHLSTEHISFDLEAGDILLFSPFVLAHRCLPPQKGKKRHTVCFTVTPFF
ncbi:hypothetical protein GV054_15975 [Marinomonas mediterranea]|uniref:Phytanoyl-CoA dioxygenase n=1 Tax=Marinomonas mediterranea (strain ATCC 700492 / JCM 21426 / NBRC 103028 / MMB-1) TaxID=717774 RepID=F2K2Z9_MARM1|nr:hypothetical protein [Marinomonas mediterranea]ADZ92388.1 hypothetical protein Marme_3171 [Marinomonas mediterranea MMB-1]WCN14386.1 hypothetical protein GV054_15975 [Marinomonas mediterranea]WCN18438.1 hypothetical protein GV053_16040 [Marinomonas mediterranea MMB-1]